MFKTVQRILRDRQGNFGVMAGILMVPVFLAAGLGVDVTNGFTVRAELDNAADIAALAALATVGRDARYRNGNTDELTQAIEQNIEDGKDFLMANLADSKSVTLKSFDVEVTSDGLDVVASVSYVAELETTFMGVLDDHKMTLSNTVRATTRLAEKINFYMLLDNTPSMGVAATEAGIAKMVKNTSDKCAFACHAVNDSDNRYKLAKKLGVKTRIDVVRESTQKLMDTAALEQLYSGQFKMGVYTFGAKAEDIKLTEVSEPSADFATQKTKAAAVDLMSIPYQGYDNDQQTSFDTILSAMEAKVGSETHAGDDTQKVVFLVSDGVGDSKKPYTCTKQLTGTRCQEPIDIRACDKLKSKGYTVAVLYTTYLPLPTNSWYNQWIKPFQSEISTRMSQCASPGLFTEVPPSGDISQAMIELFRNTTKTPRLVY